MKPFAKSRGSRGVIDPVSLTIILVLGALALWPSLHLPAFLQKKPPTKQLSQDQKDLAAAKNAQAQAEAALAAARASEAAKTQDQLRYAQQMSSGASMALAKVPAEHQTPEVKLAAELTARADNGLATAIGRLPADQQAEMTALINNALSAVTAQRDAAQAALAQKDAQLQSTTAAKLAIEAQLPVLQASLKRKDAQVAAKQTDVDEKTAEVADWAQKKAASDAEAGSWKAYAVDAVRIIAAILILWALVHFICPSLAQEFQGSKVIQAVYRWTTSIFSSHITTTTPVSTAKTNP